MIFHIIYIYILFYIIVIILFYPCYPITINIVNIRVLNIFLPTISINIYIFNFKNIV